MQVVPHHVKVISSSESFVESVLIGWTIQGLALTFAQGEKTLFLGKWKINAIFIYLSVAKTVVVVVSCPPAIHDALGCEPIRGCAPDFWLQMFLQRPSNYPNTRWNRQWRKTIKDEIPPSQDCKKKQSKGVRMETIKTKKGSFSSNSNQLPFNYLRTY